MERLSEKLTDVLRECIDALSQVEEDIIKMALNRLAAYEDTGLEPEEFKKAFNEDALLKMTAQYLGTTPDRLHEWAKADKEDRLVALPCKVGDMVLERGWKYSECRLGITPAYRPCSECEGCCAAECDSEKMAWLYTGKVVAFRVNRDCVLAQIHWDDKWDTSWYSIGKTVFLTREEAEAALAGEGGKHETD